MKRITILLSALLLLLSSCDDFLNTRSESQYDKEAVYNSVPNTEMALMGVYSLMTDDYLYSSRLSCMFPYNSDIEYAGADEKTYADDGNRGLSNYVATPAFSKASLDRVWKALYKAIERANNLIENIPTSEVYQTGTLDEKRRMDALYGEALTLRALFYFELVRHWGDVPLKLEPTRADGSNFYLPATDRDEIYTVMLTDLEDAARKLPWIGVGGTAERVNKGFAKGLRARMALAAAGYSIRNEDGFPYATIHDQTRITELYGIAQSECEGIIFHVDNPHRLNPNYKDIFHNLCQWKLDNVYFENMFEVALGYGRSGEIGYSVGVRFNGETKKYGYGNNSGVVSTSPYYYYMFDPNDARRDATVAYYNFTVDKVKDANGVEKDVEREKFVADPFTWGIAKYDIRNMNSTFLTDNLNAQGKRGYGINYTIMRYADVKLMYAEACNELSERGVATVDMQRAKEQFLEVRTRGFANNATNASIDISDYAKFKKAIKYERAYEFGGEGIRKYDLIRWGDITSELTAHNEAYGQFFTKTTVALPNGRVVSNLPSKISVVYRSDNQTIDKAATDLYTDATGEGLTSFLIGSSTMTIKGQALLKVFSSGIIGDNVTVPHRHLFPIPTVVISESGGKLKNSYGW